MILVTGASGLIGRALLRQLQQLQQARKVFVLLNKNDSILNDFNFLIPIYGGLGRLLEHVDQLNEVRHIYHFASKSIDSDGKGFSKVNIQGIKNVLALAKAVGATKLVTVSSTGVYGHGSFTNADESTALHPDTSLSISRKKAEEILSEAQDGSLEVVILRHRFIIGQGDRHVLPRFMKVARKLPFLVKGGKAKLSFIDADDLALIATKYMDLKNQLHVSEVVHVVNHEVVTVDKVLTDIGTVFGIVKKRKSIPFWPLYMIVRLKEIIFRIDPESTQAGSLSSIRLKFIAQNSHFNNEKLRARFPELEFTPFKSTLEANKSYYEKLEM